MARLITFLFCIGVLGILFYGSILPSPVSLFKKQPNVCGSASFQWTGANRKIHPQSGRPLTLKHIDYTDGLLTHDVNVLLGKSLSEEFSVDVDILTSHDLPADSFDISYLNDELTISTLIQKRDTLLSDPQTSGRKHCVVIKVQILIPVSKPLTGLAFELPQANLFIHESAHGSLPYLQADITTGNIIFASGQRLHIGTMSLKIDRGQLLGSPLITQSLTAHVREGDIDLDISYSPFLVGAELEIIQAMGTQSIRLNDTMYRPTTASYTLQSGPMMLDYPSSFTGLLSLDSKDSNIVLEGKGVEITKESGERVRPAWVEAHQGSSTVQTRVKNGKGGIHMKLADPLETKRE